MKTKKIKLSSIVMALVIILLVIAAFILSSIKEKKNKESDIVLNAIKTFKGHLEYIDIIVNHKDTIINDVFLSEKYLLGVNSSDAKSALETLNLKSEISKNFYLLENTIHNYCELNANIKMDKAFLQNYENNKNQLLTIKIRNQMGKLEKLVKLSASKIDIFMIIAILTSLIALSTQIFGMVKAMKEK